MGLAYSLPPLVNAALPDEADEKDHIWNVVDEGEDEDDEDVSTTCSVTCCPATCYDVGTLPPTFLYLFKHSDIKVFAVLSAIFLDAKNSLFLYRLATPDVLSRRVSSQGTTRDVLRIARDYSCGEMAYERLETVEDIPAALARGHGVACIISWKGLSPRLRAVNGHLTKPVVSLTPGLEESARGSIMPFVITGFSDDHCNETLLYGYVMGEDMRVSLEFTAAPAILRDLWVVDLDARESPE